MAGKKKQPKVEILAPLTGPRLPERAEAEKVGGRLEALVQRTVAKALAQNTDGKLFEPWFRSRREAQEIRRLQTVPQIKKMAEHYERYGCWSCHKNKEPHGANGFCESCYLRARRELEAILRDLQRD